MIFKSHLTAAVCAYIAFVSLSANAVTVIPSDYIIAGNIGDTWTYEKLDNTQFTWTLSEVTTGTNAGRLERGNNDSGMVYDVLGNILTVYESDKIALIPPFIIGETELDQVVTDQINPDQISPYLLLKMNSITVQAGTFNDVLAWVTLDDQFSPNIANVLLGLDPLINMAVTDIEYHARGVGQIESVGIQAATGLSDGFGFELVSTTVVPVPTAVWLFGSGLIGLIGLARRKA